MSDAPLLAGWSWPYTTIIGREDGPQATIIAGIHGCEYVSIHAAMRLAAEIDPAEIRGRVLIVPVVNLPAFQERTPFVCPIDGKNPNRFFPGRPDGTFSEVLADFIFTTCIAPSDAFFDLHGGDMVEELEPFAIFSADAAPGGRRALARIRRGVRPALHRRSARARPGSTGGMTFAAAAAVGMPGLIAEAGGIGQLTAPDVDLLVNGARRALRVAGNLTGPRFAPGTRSSGGVQLALLDGGGILDRRRARGRRCPRRAGGRAAPRAARRATGDDRRPRRWRGALPHHQRGGRCRAWSWASASGPAWRSSLGLPLWR